MSSPDFQAVRFRKKKVLAVLALAALLVALAFLMPWQDAWAVLRHAQKGWSAAALAICLLATPFGATLWWLFLKPHGIGWPRSFEIAALTVAARATLPFLGGDVSSAGLLVVRGGLTPGAAILVLMQDQLFTGIGKAAIVLAVFACVSMPAILKAAGLTLIFLVTLLLAAMLALALQGDALERLAAMLPSRARVFVQRMAGLARPLEMLRRPVRFAAALVLTLLTKTVEVGVTYAAQRAVGLDLPWADTLLVVAALDLSAVVPGPPSRLGIFEATALLVYRSLGVGPGQALAAALLNHVIYIAADFAYGYAVLIAGMLRRARASGPA